MPLKSPFFLCFWQRSRGRPPLWRTVQSAVLSGLVYLGEMIRPRVYVETTIPSAYFEVRTSATMVARREWTREWWAEAPERYELVTSTAVVDELSAGRPERSAERAALVRDLPLLPVVPAVIETVQAYVRHKLMPRDTGGDALHLALASYHKCDFLVTWNCQNLANANKFAHIRRINALLGLHVPSLVTPLSCVEETMPTPDPIVDEVRQIRHEMSARFGHDPARLVEYLMEFQEQYRDRLVYLPEPPETGKSAA